MKICIRCNTEYKPTGNSQKYCLDCKDIVLKENSKTRSYKYAVKIGRIKNPGVGSGNSQKELENHHSWVNGIGSYRKIAFKTYGYNCNRCGVDVRTLRPYQYSVHHKNRNRNDNSAENLEVLCKSCHQVEHDCILNLYPKTKGIVQASMKIEE